MQLSFIGGAESVTGSASLLVDERLGVRFLVDCGTHAERGAGFADGAPKLGFDARRLDFVVLTHAHRDHTGRLPQLHRAGFRGPVYCTEATAWMTELALRDAAKFSDEYDAADVELIDFQPLDRRPDFRFDRALRMHGLWLTLHRSAHILGAAAVTVTWRSRVGMERSIVFSGDIGGNTPDNPFQSLLAGQTLPGAADYMVVESTRGAEPAREPHYKSFAARMVAWAEVFADSDARGGGPVIAPCFAIHRAQELLFDLDYVLRTTDTGRPDTTGRPRWLSLDAPLAVRMTDVFAMALADGSGGPEHAPVYRNPRLAERLGLANEAEVDAHLAALWQRVRLNRAPGGTLRAMRDPALSRMIALAGSGMCQGGRIVDFIVDQIGNPAATIVLCGYAPPDTGAGRLRQLVAGEWPLDRMLALGNARIDPARVQARIVDFGDYYSGHGDIDALARFVFERDARATDTRAATVYLNHGDHDMRTGLAETLRERAAAAQAGDRAIERIELAEMNRIYDLDAADQAWRDRPTPRLNSLGRS
ncbi:MBL fold metallo-hydrolase [Salinisphaera hydrothermalis]|uniref:Beta-lactamase domain-containing protein n=1 Tax=Salinisphaera hydrothermalis (strain C41B8) TaxID=1304275 RepID=A0A084IPV0_SALHC|nr:MBL fold metallo-hydrolase [Salinisphaera hydrothermalis]KEZ78734.1 beta-lactamase domain-containing protein [Salinisphaera hydrothermalis C41B8]